MGIEHKLRAIDNMREAVADPHRAPHYRAPLKWGALYLLPHSPYKDNVQNKRRMNLSRPPFPGGKEGAQSFFYPEGSLVGVSTVGGETQAVDRSPCAFGDPEAPPEAASWAFSRLEGDLQKPEGYVAHFYLDANSEQGDPFPRAGRSVVLSVPAAVQAGLERAANAKAGPSATRPSGY
jgi:hypothetical protein